MAVIELDLHAPPAPAPTRPPIHLLRPLGLALTVVLLLTLGGAAPITPSLWRPLGMVPLGDDDSRYELSGDRLYILDSQVGTRREVSSWSLDLMRRDWTFATGAPTTDGVYSRANLASVNGVLLLQSELFVTSVLDPGTGAVLWTTPGWPAPLGGGRGLIQESHFRPGTEYDLKSGDAGELFWSSSGQPHIEPPLSTSLSGVDIRTGKRIWTAESPGSVFTAPVDDGSGVLVVAADKLTVLDRDTGRVLREQAMPRRAGDDYVAWVDVVGEVLLVRRGPSDQVGTVVAYATDTLAKRWEAEDPADQAYNGDCTGLPCLKGPAGLTVLNPRTGQAAWRVGRDARLVQRGDAVLQVQPSLDQPVRMRDPATGASLVELTHWNGTPAAGESDQPLVVSRIEPARQSTVFGVLPLGGTKVQPLGYAGAIMIECSANDRYVACRVPGGIEVWAYRA